MKMYRFIDKRGRVTIPTPLLEASGLQRGDLIRLAVKDGVLHLGLVFPFDPEDEDAQRVRSVVLGGIHSMDQMALAEVQKHIAERMRQLNEAQLDGETISAEGQ